MIEERYHTLGEVAELLHVSERTVHRWIRSGVLAAYKPGGDWRIRATDLESFIEARKAPFPKVQASLPFDAPERTPEQRRKLFNTQIHMVKDAVNALQRQAEDITDEGSAEVILHATSNILRDLYKIGALDALRDILDQRPGDLQPEDVEFHHLVGQLAKVQRKANEAIDKRRGQKAEVVDLAWYRDLSA